MYHITPGPTLQNRIFSYVYAYTPVWNRVFFYSCRCTSTVSQPGPTLCETGYLFFYVHTCTPVQNLVFFYSHRCTPTVSHTGPTSHIVQNCFFLSSHRCTFAVSQLVFKSVYTGARWGLDQISKIRLHEKLQEEEAGPRKVPATWPVHPGDGQHTTEGNPVVWQHIFHPYNTYFV